MDTTTGDTALTTVTRALNLNPSRKSNPTVNEAVQEVPVKVRNHLHSCPYYGTPVPISECGCLEAMLDQAEARVAKLEARLAEEVKDRDHWKALAESLSFPMTE